MTPQVFALSTAIPVFPSQVADRPDPSVFLVLAELCVTQSCLYSAEYPTVRCLIVMPKKGTEFHIMTQ